MGQNESHEALCNKRRRSEDPQDDARGHQLAKRHKEKNTATQDRQPRETIYIPDGDEPVVTQRGKGTEEDPITLTEWVTGNVINVHDDELVSVISDDEDNVLDSLLTTRRMSTPINSQTVWPAVDYFYNADEDTVGPSSPLLESSDACDKGIDRGRGMTSTSSRSLRQLFLDGSKARGYGSKSSLKKVPPSFVDRALSSEEEGRNIEQSNTPFRSPTPEQMPNLEVNIHGDWKSSVREYGYENRPEQASADEEAISDDEDETSHGIIDASQEVDDAELDRIFFQIPIWEDWKEQSVVKNEPKDDVPALTFSQESEPVQGLDTPMCSQAAKSPSGPTETRKLSKQWEMTKYKKRLFYKGHNAAMEPTLRRLKNKFVGDFATTKGEDECWIYAGSSFSGSSQNISVMVTFWHGAIQYKLCIHLAFVIMLLDGLLTEEAKEGIIEHWWSASHLCGNWRCVNVRHICPEPGSVNSSRNSCFHGGRQVCIHDPPCRKHLTVSNAKRSRPLPKTRKLEAPSLPDDDDDGVDGLM
jgi:hypothetical protein